jgi:hypothetical protein
MLLLYTRDDDAWMDRDVSSGYLILRRQNWVSRLRQKGIVSRA